MLSEGSISWALLLRSSLTKMLVEREVAEVLGGLQVGGGGGGSDGDSDSEEEGSEEGCSFTGDTGGFLRASIFSSSFNRSQIHGCSTQARQKCMSNGPSR